MAYCIQADVENEAGGAQALVELCDLARTRSGVLETAVLDAAIADADAWINGYVAKKRAVPLAAPVPAVIKRISQQEAVYILRGNTRFTGERDREKHDENHATLRDIARGISTLGVDPQPAKSALVSPAVVLVDDDDNEITATNTEGIW